MARLFSMKDLGPLSYFLGMEVHRSANGMHMAQAKYVMDLLTRTNMLDCKPVSTHAINGHRLSLYDGEPFSDVTEFRSVVGVLQYLTFTRPDIAFAVNQVCQYMHRPTTTHWIAVKHILRYLKTTPDHGLVYKPSSFNLVAYADADYAGDPDDRKSTGGYCIFLGNNLISWSSNKQRGVSRSSTESDYRQLAYTAATISWFRKLFNDLRVPLSPPKIWCDNISAISLAFNHVFHTRPRHVEVGYHYIREKDEYTEGTFTKQNHTQPLVFYLTQVVFQFRHLQSKLHIRPDYVQDLEGVHCASEPSIDVHGATDVFTVVGSG
ncbi:uncharacterized mitochondrial protein AtMg00810-like [Pyrus x bretschneideri]|uniref:uncharacterized mitochondrial protein AtMg00810-like n=1 Tax=Pyrus x bretschneideri TaxID=225117 RepID=UPI00202E7DBE|nr:uncharacterized mitochondrial protein AtMg00810-like [Pyrus x bretschneideri]